jgi:hypothetical protein
MSNAVTPTRTIRVDDELWAAVQDQAKEDGVTVTSIIIDGLYNYLKDAKSRRGMLE